MVAPAAAAALSSRSSSTTTLQVIYDVHNGDKRPAALVCKIFYKICTSYRFLTTRRCGSKILFVCMYQIYEKTLPFKSSCEWFWTRSDSCVFFRIFKKMSNVSAAFKRVGRQ